MAYKSLTMDRGVLGQMVEELRAFLGHYAKAAAYLRDLEHEGMPAGKARSAWVAEDPYFNRWGKWNALCGLLLRSLDPGPPPLTISARYLGPPFSDPDAFASALQGAKHPDGLDPLLAPVRGLLGEVLDALDEAERGPWVTCTQAKVIQFYGVMQWPVGKPARFMQRLLRDGAIEGEPAGRYGWRFRFTDPARQRDLLAWLGPGLDAEAPGVEREWNGSGTGAAPE